MSEVYFNKPLTGCSGSQYRIRLEGKLRNLLDEKMIIGPMDAAIIKCVEEGKIPAEKKDDLLEISKFCDFAFSCPEFPSPSRDTIRAWSDVIDSL